jgi:hypothetical protein
MSIAEKLQIIAENEQKVFNAGAKSEYDKFWDNYQQNGTRVGGRYLFSGVGWNSENFKPKYKVAIGANKYPTYSTGMFYFFDNLQKKAPLEIDESVIDFSQATILDRTFSDANISKVEMNVIPPNLTTMTETFAMSNISTHKLETIKIGVNENTTYSNGCFLSGALKNVSFIDGSIIGTNITFSSCKRLTKESITNIINVLSTNTTAKTLTLSVIAVNTAFETAEGLADGSTSTEWTTLIATKSNWTISLV